MSAGHQRHVHGRVHRDRPDHVKGVIVPAGGVAERTPQGAGRLIDDPKLQAELASLTFARADAWIATWGTGQRDKPLRSLKSVIVIGLRGIGQLTATAFKSLKPR